MKYLGIDFGDKHIGLAVSSEEGAMAFPLEALSNNAQLIENIRSIVKEKNIEGIVMGESKDFKGNENPIMKKAKKFAGELGTALSLPVHFEPEFMTSVEARHIQGGGDKTHSSAAALILKSFIERQANN